MLGEHTLLSETLPGKVCSSDENLMRATLFVRRQCQVRMACCLRILHGNDGNEVVSLNVDSKKER